MKATDEFIEQFEAPKLCDLIELSYGNLVRVKSGHEDYEGEVTASPYFICSFACNYPNNEELAANGGWWVEVGKIRYSLNDYNVIKNKYNNHSITLIKARGE
ncbi:hypothetical protein OAA60_03425 [Porticoccaceae bacterium]|nr:hypothetical protein [Porticoccaceae bacterium]